MKGTRTTKIFADRLQELISSSGKDMKTLETEIGVSAPALSKYQNDGGEAGINALEKIAEYFGVTADYLIGISDNKILENEPIGNELNLSDEAVEMLRWSRDDSFLNSTINALLENEDFLVDIARYFFLNPVGGAFAVTSIGGIAPVSDVEPKLDDEIGRVKASDLITEAILSNIKNELEEIKKEMEDKSWKRFDRLISNSKDDLPF